MFKSLIASALAVLATAKKDVDWDQAEISRQFSVMSYCGYKQYETMPYKHALEGFEWKATLKSGFTKDTEGFVGYLPSDDSIWVAFRGSSSISNWITNLDTVKSKYNMWPECKCKVHAGFEGAANSVADTMMQAITELKEKYPSAKIKTTGHSLGGALANLSAMTIQKQYPVDQMINFGQPRVGDDDYAAFADEKIANQWRFIHHRDLVPHVPPKEFPFGFYHTSTEVFEDKHGNYTICKPGEDKHCADQYWTYSIGDHMTYMDKCMGSCGMCPKHDEEEFDETWAPEPHSDEFEYVPQSDFAQLVFGEVQLILN